MQAGVTLRPSKRPLKAHRVERQQGGGLSQSRFAAGTAVGRARPQAVNDPTIARTLERRVATALQTFADQPFDSIYETPNAGSNGQLTYTSIVRHG